MLPKENFLVKAWKWEWGGGAKPSANHYANLLIVKMI